LAIELQAGQEQSLDVTLECAATLRGVVVDEADAPLPDAWVSAAYDAEPSDDAHVARSFARPPVRVLTDDTGHFSIEHLCADATYRIQASLDRGGSGSSEKAVPSEQIRVVARWHGNIEGQIIAPEGIPVADCLVTIVHEATQQSRVTRVAATGGSFMLDDLPSGPSTISVQGPGVSGRASVVVPSGQTLRGAQIVVARGDVPDDGS
jgi:hypothetical protein